MSETGHSDTAVLGGILATIGWEAATVLLAYSERVDGQWVEPAQK